MSQWNRVKWSRANQAVNAAFLDSAGQRVDLDASATPEAYFMALRAASQQDLAITFLALALPRLEAVVWAADAVRTLAPPDGSSEADTLRAVLQWTEDPSEAGRRAAADAAQHCETTSPAWLTAMAAFYSGGSIAPADCEPLPAPLDAAGRFAAGAILVTCAGLKDPDAGLETCLEAGARLATEGLRARIGR